MKKILAVLGCSIWCVATVAQSSKPSAKRLSDLHQITEFQGSFPCENGLLHSPALRSALRRTLKQDFREYQTHISLAGCGRVEIRDQYVFMDVSQLHVGGYTSYIFIRPSDGETYVFWLNSTTVGVDRN